MPIEISHSNSWLMAIHRSWSTSTWSTQFNFIQWERWTFHWFANMRMVIDWWDPHKEQALECFFVQTAVLPETVKQDALGLNGVQWRKLQCNIMQCIEIGYISVIVCIEVGCIAWEGRRQFSRFSAGSSKQPHYGPPPPIPPFISFQFCNTTHVLYE